MEQSSHAAKPALHAGPSEQFWNNFGTILEQFWNNFGTILKLVEKRANFHLGFCVQVMD